MYDPKLQRILRGIRDGFFKGPQVPKIPIDMFYHRACVVAWLLRWFVVFLFAVWLLIRWEWLGDLFGIALTPAQIDQHLPHPHRNI